MPLRRALAGLIVSLAALVSPAVAADTKYTISDFDAPFGFYYVGWNDKIQVADGRVTLKAMPTAGGAGVNKPHDLGAYANLTPAFRLRTTAANTARTIQLQLLDADGRNATWHFQLPGPSADFVTVLPDGSVAVSRPHAIARSEKPDNVGALDLAKILQFKVQGDWQQGVMDLEIDAIVLVEPDVKMLADREEYRKVEEAAAAQKAKDLAAANEKLAKEREGRIKSYSHSRGEGTPEVTHISLAAPDVLSVTIEAQRTIPSTMSKYEPQPGDEKKLKMRKDGTVHYADLIRNGRRIGRLQGKDLDWFFTDERLDGAPLLEFLLEMPEKYRIASKDDANYTSAVQPLAAYRKSVPRDVVLPGGQHPTRHRVYLKLPSPVQAGKTYSVEIATINVKLPATGTPPKGGVNSATFEFKADLPNVRSESVHVNQIGYRPDDPVKRAFLSVWLGSGGAYTFPDGLGFSLIEEATNKVVFTGKTERIMTADGTEQLWTKPAKNYSNTAVYRMDYGTFRTPGAYRVYVDGVGCSYPFVIAPTAWEKAFLTQMAGLYKQRCGVEVGPPYSDFKKPRDFHPDDGTIITRSKYDVLSKGGPHAYKSIVDGDTGEVVKDAWGGYHDAGDWNPRRVTHMSTTLAQLELCELYPDYFNKLKLRIPPTEGLPDIITEALFEIDCFRRLQLPDGAVPHGIETDGDPGSGEVSWLSTQKCYVLAPTIRDSWLYAAVAGRAAKVLKPIKPVLSQVYLDSAVRAFNWAEAELARKRAAGETLERKDYWDSFDARNLSSLILYDITGDKAYHDVFMQDTCLKKPGEEIYAWGWNIQSDQVFLYARMDASKTDPRIRENARVGVISLAERSLKYAAGNAFNITQREPGRPMFAGFFSTPGGSELVRAHYLTKNPEYLKGAVQSCLFPAGCNPGNIVYTTGLGSNPVRVPLELDARSSGQAVPPGLTVFGNTDYFNHRNSFWDINLRFVNKPEIIWPDAYSWPLTEAYFDAWVLVSANEYVIDTWAPNVLVWGYLAARPEVAQ